jgi:DNA-binding PadR family transcriptional regulator
MQVTIPVLRVLNVFLEQPDGHHYGLELMKSTGLQSGSLYPILARLERMGWLVSSKEEIDPRAEKRPARRYYQITGEGVRNARLAKAELMAQLRQSTGGFLPGVLRPEGQVS